MFHQGTTGGRWRGLEVLFQFSMKFSDLLGAILCGHRQ